MASKEEGDSNNGASNDKRIVVVAIDASHTAEHAFDWYIEHLHKRNNFVIIVHAVDVQPVHAYPSVFVKPEVYQKELQKAKDHAHGLEEKYIKKMKDRDVDGRMDLLPGKPGEVLVHVANDNKAELLITGTRGVGTLRRTILGSVSDYVVHHAHCAVVTVRKNVPI